MERSVAVIGAGYWGKNLVRNHYEIGSLHTVCDSDEGILEGFRERFPGTAVSTSYEAVLDDPGIRGVVIALPAALHFRHAEAALRAGKHVYVEKPLALELEEAERLVELADSRELVLMVGHLLQYHPAFLRLQELVRSGELGPLCYIYSNRLSLGKIRREENILWSFAPHDISMILSLCGEEPCEVYATGGNYLQEKIADVTVTNLTFPGGVRSHIFVSWLHPFKEQKLVVVGRRKMAVFSDTEPWERKLLLYPHSIVWQNGLPVPEKAEAVPVVVGEAEPLKNECLHFLECIDGGKTPRTDGQEGIRVLRVLDRAQRSLGMNGGEG